MILEILGPIPLWRSSGLSLKPYFSNAPRASRHDWTTPVPRRVINHSIGRDDSRGDRDSQAMARTQTPLEPTSAELLPGHRMVGLHA
jgi:hypothetical protein